MKEYINDANSGRLLMVTVRRLNQERERERERDGGERGKDGGRGQYHKCTVHPSYQTLPPPPPTHTHTHTHTHTCTHILVQLW